MISIVITRDINSNISDFDITGHASAAKPGEDIVCAAVSVLAQTTLLGLHHVVKVEIEFERDSGDIFCRMPEGLTPEKREAANILLETMVIGFKNLVVGYPTYIELHDKEV